MVEAVRVFVGTSVGGQDVEACIVLEHSIRRRTSARVEVMMLAKSENSRSLLYGWDSTRWVTPWTAYRWAVPELCDFSGRAVYFDCPTIVFGDIAELASAAMPRGAAVLMHRAGRTLSTSCIVFDCAAAGKSLPKVADLKKDVGAHQTVGRLLERRPKLVGPLPGNWGASDWEFARAPREHFESVHFERPHTAPHVPRARARLARAGKHHWFSGVVLPHYCSILAQAYDAEYELMQREAAE